MNLLNRFSFLSSLLLVSSISFAQQPHTDLAISHNRLLTEKTGEGVYKLVGPYKVIGTCYLFGEKNKGDLFSTEAKAYNIYLSYNTHKQELEFYSTSNPDKSLTKAPGEVDSFIIHQNMELGIISPLKFVYGAHIGSSDKSYFQEVFSGNRYSIYKKYKTDLGYVSTNYIQSELRQFDLDREYYYTYTDTEKKSIKKIKPNAFSVIKEFKSVKDLSSVISDDAMTLSPDEAFRKAFEYLNK